MTREEAVSTFLRLSAARPCPETFDPAIAHRDHSLYRAQLEGLAWDAGLRTHNDPSFWLENAGFWHAQYRFEQTHHH